MGWVGAVSDSQERIKGAGSHGGGGRNRQVGGLKGCNGCTGTAVGPWGLLSSEVAVRQAAASFRIIE